jgi:ribosomal protein L7Ae-like RNA K-turn-binding protein
MVTDRQWRLMGLGLKAGSLAIGSAGVRAGLQRGEVALVVMAEDRSPRTEEKVGRLAGHRGVAVLIGPSSQDLGRRLGRPPVQAVGVRDRALAAGMVGTADTDT